MMMIKKTKIMKFVIKGSFDHDNCSNNVEWENGKNGRERRVMKLIIVMVVLVVAT